MPKLCLLVRAATALTLLCATPSAAQENGQACAKRALVVQKLEERFGETLRSLGLQRDDGVVEIYSSEETGTWTILMTDTSGQTCLVAAGEAWKTVPVQAVMRGEPT